MVSDSQIMTLSFNKFIFLARNKSFFHLGPLRSLIKFFYLLANDIFTIFSKYQIIKLKIWHQYLNTLQSSPLDLYTCVLDIFFSFLNTIYSLIFLNFARVKNLVINNIFTNSCDLFIILNPLLNISFHFSL